MKKRLISIVFAFIAITASSTIAHADPGCIPPIIPYPTDIIQHTSVDTELMQTDIHDSMFTDCGERRIQ